MTSGSIPINQRVAGRYEVLGEIARGRMALVYRVMDHELGREAALKILGGTHTSDPRAIHRFVDEVRITAQLQHPGIPPVFDIGKLPDGRPFMTLKLIQGRALDALLSERPDPTAGRGRFLAVFEQVCQAVAYAHAKGVVHRGLGPANVMIGSFGEVQVLDWGLALVIPEKGSGAVVAEGAQFGAIFGSTAYMAPEQARGEAADFRADVFGLGGILCHVLTGGPPFTGGGFAAVARKAAAGDLGDAFARLDDCGAEAELVALAKKCLRPRPEDRPTDAMQVASLLVTARDAAWRRSR
jgi:eukaryotic-like serine/threonine-protein kinase